MYIKDSNRLVQSDSMRLVGEKITEQNLKALEITISQMPFVTNNLSFP